jgi:hypothetical protein
MEGLPMKRLFLSGVLHALVLCSLILFAAGCAAGRGDGAASMSVAEEAAEAPAAAGMAASAEYDAAGVAVESETVAEAAVGGQIDTAALQGRRIIRNAHVQIEADDVLAVLNEATALSTRFGGYTTQSRAWYVNDRPRASIAFAVPVERFESAMQAVRELGAVQDEQVSSQDVTAQFVDLEARIRNLESTVERVRGFLDEAENVEDALAVNNELSSLEAQLETLKGQRNALAQQTAFSTIAIEFVPAPPQITTQDVLNSVQVWSPSETFNDALDALLRVMQVGADAAIWLAVLGIPALLVLAALWWIARRIGWAIRRTAKKETVS